MSNASLPLAGIKVLDLNRHLAGSYCTALLADAGADVVKAEPLPRGDNSRAEYVYYLSVNRNKRSIALDLRTEDGRLVLGAMLGSMDVLVENFTPGVMDDLGFSEDMLRSTYPRLIHATLSGLGTRGPDSRAPGLDQVAQGMSGIMSVNGTAEVAPVRVGFPVSDVLAGNALATGIACAIAGRALGRPVGRVTTSLLESSVSALTFQAQAYLSKGEVPAPTGNDHPVISPYGAFRAADGWLNISVTSPRHWEALCSTIGRPDLCTDARFADRSGRQRHREELTHEIELALSRRGVGEWVHELRGQGVPVGPIYTLDQVFADPQVIALDLVQTVEGPEGGSTPLLRGPIWHDGQPPAVRQHPPLFGQHTRTVLGESGFSEDEIDRLLESGVVREHPVHR